MPAPKKVGQKAELKRLTIAEARQKMRENLGFLPKEESPQESTQEIVNTQSSETSVETKVLESANTLSDSEKRRRWVLGFRN